MSYESTDGYEPGSMEDDIFLSDVPPSVMLESIRTQFDDPTLDNKTDYVTTFIDTYDSSKEECEDEDEVKQLREIKENFYAEIRQLFRDNFNLGFPNFEDQSESGQDSLIRFSYRYFILHMKKNFSHLVQNYIDNNRDEVLSICEKKKDVTTLAYKKDASDPDDLLILSNVPTIVRYVLGMEFDVDDFLELSMGNHDYECEYVDQAYDDVRITGNFVSQYMKMIDQVLIQDISDKVRSKLLKRIR